MTHPRSERMLTVDQLRAGVADESIETVVVAFTDMQGRLQGKYLHAPYFVEHALGHGVEGCNYLLAVDTEMNTVDGYAISSWEAGYGDMEFTLDTDTIRRVPWLERTVMIQCDLALTDGSPVPMSPRSMLASQVERAAGHGWSAVAGTELEFVVYRDSYEDAWAKGYAGLTPANQYNVDYSIVGSGRVEPLLRRIRSDMFTAGMTVESAKGECNFGQHEINFRFDSALDAADGHAIYKNGAKEIAADLGYSLTFMPKFDEREGSSCHIHLSLKDEEGSTVFAADGGHGFSPLFERFLAGQLAGLRELTLMFAPNINSYKRYTPGSFAPTAVA